MRRKQLESRYINFGHALAVKQAEAERLCRRFRASGPFTDANGTITLILKIEPSDGHVLNQASEFMPVNKQHLEFHAVDFDSGWQSLPGYPAGIQEKILAGHLDEENKQGGRTRLLRFDAGVYTTKPFVHDYWEEVWLLSGDLIVGNDAHGNGGQSYAPNTYACRPPGAVHGPFKSQSGCMLLEHHYYDESARD